MKPAASQLCAHWMKQRAGHPQPGCGGGGVGGGAQLCLSRLTSHAPVIMLSMGIIVQVLIII